MVFGVSGDKNVLEMLIELQPRVTHFIATQSAHPRAMPPQTLAALAQELGYANEIAQTVSDALTCAEELVQANGIILITGSLFVVGEARTLLNQVL
jgi:dihydrofolate synthase/folylpolyglutamate synthase